MGTVEYYLTCMMKFGRHEDMQALIDKGTIYMNSINSFRQAEDKFLRGDAYEGASQIWNLPKGKMTIPQLNYTGDYISMHLKESYETVVGNIYSLYCISSHGFKSPRDIDISSRVKEFGSHLVLIANIPEFFRRVEAKLDLIGYGYSHRLVEYYDKYKINGKLTVFNKPDVFEYQKEYRFYVKRPEITPLVFDIGNISDIAYLFPVERLDERDFLQLRPV